MTFLPDSWNQNNVPEASLLWRRKQYSRTSTSKENQQQKYLEIDSRNLCQELFILRNLKLYLPAGTSSEKMSRIKCPFGPPLCVCTSLLIPVRKVIPAARSVHFPNRYLSTILHGYAKDAVNLSTAQFLSIQSIQVMYFPGNQPLKSFTWSEELVQWECRSGICV